MESNKGAKEMNENTCKKEGATAEDRLAYTFHLLESFMVDFYPDLSRQQFLRLYQILCLTAEPPITEMDKQWANAQIDELYGKEENNVW